MKIGDKVRILVKYKSLKKDEIGYLKKPRGAAPSRSGGIPTLTINNQLSSCMILN